MRRSVGVLLALLALLAAPCAWTQNGVSARSGVLNYSEGDVRIAGSVEQINGTTYVQQGETLRTVEGHAEILLAPGVFLRLGRNSSFTLLSDRITDVRVKIAAGTALVDAIGVPPDTRVEVQMGDSVTVLSKNGLYHFNAAAGQIRAFEGEATVSEASQAARLGPGRMLALGPALTPAKFKARKSRDELYTWSRNRDVSLGLANSPARAGSASSFDLGACPGNVPGDPVTCEPAGLR